ncbi:hypothetical protein ACFWBM_23095 [Streptomyces sp. NPDC059980]|uniref:hypothetical protein n=1 Tax=Streptomyces sp. NPDC059980 TaxID=3347022 RepID=UPI00369C6916
MQANQAEQQTGTLNKENDRETKRQAVQVAVQPRTGFTEHSRIAVITNRSSNPVYQLRVYAAFSRSPADTKHGDLTFLLLGSLSPCTEVKVNLNLLADDQVDTRKARREHRPLDYGVTFTDSLGKGFHRHAAGMINPSAWLEYVDNGSDTPKLPGAFALFDAQASSRGSAVIGALTAGVRNKQHGVAGTPSKADLCTNGQ